MRSQTKNRIRTMIGICLLLAFVLLVAACGKEENPLTAGDYDAEGNFIQLAWYPKAEMNSMEDRFWKKDQNGYMTYTGDGYVSHMGIDISSNQDYINWNKVKEAGVEFVILRTGFRTYGSGMIKTDECFYWNMKKAKEAGLLVGVYVFSQAVDEEEAREEAQFVLDMLHGEVPDLPVFYDTEEITYDAARTDGLSGEQLTKNAIAFCKAIQKAGLQPGIYANQMWLCNTMDLEKLEQYPIWLAKYTEELNFPYRIQCWQYSDQGSVAGISGSVDLDVWIEEK